MGRQLSTRSFEHQTNHFSCRQFLIISSSLGGRPSMWTHLWNTSASTSHCVATWVSALAFYFNSGGSTVETISRALSRICNSLPESSKTINLMNAAVMKLVRPVRKWLKSYSISTQNWSLRSHKKESLTWSRQLCNWDKLRGKETKMRKFIVLSFQQDS